MGNCCTRNHGYVNLQRRSQSIPSLPPIPYKVRTKILIEKCRKYYFLRVSRQCSEVYALMHTVHANTYFFDTFLTLVKGPKKQKCQKNPNVTLTLVKVPKKAKVSKKSECDFNLSKSVQKLADAKKVSKSCPTFENCPKAGGSNKVSKS